MLGGTRKASVLQLSFLQSHALSFCSTVNGPVSNEMCELTEPKCQPFGICHTETHQVACICPDGVTDAECTTYGEL